MNSIESKTILPLKEDSDPKSTEKTMYPDEKPDSSASKHYDDMPKELIEFLLKTDPRQSDSSMEKNTYSKDTAPNKKGVPATKDKSAAKHKSKPYFKHIPRKSFYVLSGMVCLLLVMFILIFSLNSTNKKFDKAMAELNSLKDLNLELQKVRNDNNVLKNQINNIEEKLDNPSGLSNNQTSANNEDGDSDSGEIEITSETTYTVVAGDNLSKISIKFYGDAKSHTKIMEANNLKNANELKVGMQLKIPPR